MSEPDDSVGAGVPFWLKRAWWISTGRASLAVYIGTALSFLATMIISRSLERSSYGSVLLATAVVGSLASFLDFSFEDAVVHYGARSEIRGDIAGLKALVHRSASLDLSIGVGVFAVAVLSAPLLSQISSKGTVSPIFFRIAALEVLLLTLNGTTGAILMVAGKAELRGWAISAAGALRVGAVALAIAVDPTPTAILWAYVISSGLAALFQGGLASLVARRKWPGPRGELPVSNRRLVSFGLQSSVTTTLLALEAVLVASLLGRNQGIGEVAIFEVAIFPVTAAALATAPLRLTSIAEQARLAALGRGDLLWASIKSFMKVAVPVGLAGVVAGWFLLEWLIPALYSNKYEASIDSSRILLVAAFALFVTAWTKQLPTAVGRPGIRTAMAAVEIVLTVSLVFALIGRGAEGAAIGVSAASVVVAAAWVWIAHHMLHDRATDRTP